MELITSLLPRAVAVALSPMPIAALILLLLSNKAKLNSIAFLFGWVGALIVNLALFMLIFNAPVNANSNKSEILMIVHLVLGFILLFFAFKEWKMRPRPGETPKMPNWMNTIEKMSPVMAFIIAFGLVTVNAKNTIIDISAGVEIGQNASSIEQAVIVLGIYVFIASITIIVPVFGFLVFGKKLNSKLENLKTWFLFHNATILFVLFLILGLELIAKAI